MNKRIVSAVLAVACAMGLSPVFVQSGKAADIPLEPKYDSFLVYDPKLAYIKGIPNGIIADDLKKEFDTDVTVSDPSGKTVAGY